MSDTPNPPELEELFGSMREDGLSDHEVMSIVNGVRSRIDGGSGGGGGANAAWRLRYGFAAGLLVVAGGTWLAMERAAQVPAPGESMARHVDSPVTPSEPSPVASPVEAVAEVVHTSVVEDAPPPSPRDERRRRIGRSQEAAPLVDDSLAAHEPIPEHVLLSDARRSLQANPRHALELTESHRHEYPSGLLTPEREMIAIDALLALGREAEARTRAASVFRRWPNSSHAARLVARDLVETNP